MKKSWFGGGLWPGPCVFTLSVRSLAVAASLTLGACTALTNPSIPHVGIVKDGKVSIPTNPTFPEAKEIAQSTIKELSNRAEDLDQFDLATGSLLVGAGIAGLALGIYDAHSDAVYGAALGAGTAYAGRSFLPFRDRKAVYRKGSNAIACVMSTVSLAVQETNSSISQLETIPEPASNVPDLLQARSGLMSAPPGGDDEPAFTVLRALAGAKADRLASSVNEHRTDAKDLADSLTSAISTRGIRLHEAVRTIVEVVNTKVDNLPITPDDALTAALDQVGSTNKLLAEKAKNLKESGDDSSKDAEDAKESLILVSGLAQNSLRAAKNKPLTKEDKAEKAKNERAKLIEAATGEIEMLQKGKEAIETLKTESEEVTTISDGVLKLLGNPGKCVASLK
ncbi:hypothetical protein [Nisaea sp.]|uniref:hypothetical protein n=1 Tax=Nisaea sp. TaxID=2024842 RepID=UPI003298726E